MYRLPVERILIQRCSGNLKRRRGLERRSGYLPSSGHWSCFGKSSILLLDKHEEREASVP